ncbi:MAG: transposase zinc-binding domain-containing protein [Fibrobacteria bacterium]
MTRVIRRAGGCLPKFVTGELQGFLRCGILAYGFAHMPCDSCRKRHLVAFSCKGRGFCPSCMGRRMNEGAVVAGLCGLYGGTAP